MDSWIAEELEYAEQAWKEASSWPALGEAFNLCRFNDQPLPAWLHTAIAEILNDAFTPGKPKQRGRGSRPRQRAFQRQKDYHIYLVVEDIRSLQKSKSKSERLNLEEVYQSIADNPPNKNIAASADTIRKTYERVRKNVREGNGYLYFDGWRRRRDEVERT